jgi:hypothetical protein
MITWPSPIITYGKQTIDRVNILTMCVPSFLSYSHITNTDITTWDEKNMNAL